MTSTPQSLLNTPQASSSEESTSAAEESGTPTRSPCVPVVTEEVQVIASLEPSSPPGEKESGNILSSTIPKDEPVEVASCLPDDRLEIGALSVPYAVRYLRLLQTQTRSQGLFLRPPIHDYAKMGRTTSTQAALRRDRQRKTPGSAGTCLSNRAVSTGHKDPLPRYHQWRGIEDY